MLVAPVKGIKTKEAMVHLRKPYASCVWCSQANDGLIWFATQKFPWWITTINGF
jgi:hypothetical protein